MKIFVFIFALSLALASTHEQEMELLRNQLYQDGLISEADEPSSQEQSSQVEDQVSTANAAATTESEQSFRDRRKKVLDTLSSEKEIQIIDLESLYFSDTSNKK